jgi:hypothetical protein
VKNMQLPLHSAAQAAMLATLRVGTMSLPE